MKKLKLEVGKTYVNRRGEEVKIVRKDNTDRYPYQGSDDEWYTESGRFDICFEDPLHDLIEEAPSETIRHTFTIPGGVTKLTVEQVSNRIIVEMVPEAKAPKPGDVMVNEHGSVYVFKAVANNDYHMYYVWVVKTGWLFIDNGCCAPGRPATPEEAQPLFDALKKAGKRWNSETMQVEEIPEIDRILEWVETRAAEGNYNHKQLCWLIEEYLKHKEDKQ